MREAGEEQGRLTDVQLEQGCQFTISLILMVTFRVESVLSVRRFTLKSLHCAIGNRDNEMVRSTVILMVLHCDISS